MESPGSCSQEAARTLMSRQQSEYCAELLQRDGMERSFEEARAQRFFQRRQLLLDEKLQRLRMAQECLSSELEEKKRLLHQRLTQGAGQPPCGPGFQVYDESESQPLSTGSQLQDDVFLRPGETGLALRVQCPEAERLHVSDQKQGGTIVQVRSSTPAGAGEKVHALPEEEPMALMVGHPGAVSQKLPKSRTNLSPIEEAGDSSSLVEPPGPPGDTSDSALRRKLLEGLESMSCPDLHSGLGLAPAVEEHSPLLLGDRRFLVQSRLLEHQSFSIYGAVTQESSVILKVEKDWSLWDFHMIRRLKTMSPEAAPEISCYLFEDSCITVYRAPPGCSISVLQECVAGEDSLQKLVPSLLHLLSLLRSCGLVHGDLQPGVLACVNSDLLHSTWLFPLKWSSSVDLDLQRDVVSLQQLPAAQTYISQGFLDPSASPHQLDQVGVAQTIHLLLTSRPMVPVEDSQGWTARDFKEERRGDTTWRPLLRALLSAGTSEILEGLTF
ncbi:uncharacterized protein LOC128768769 isoform X2 [Synchiropus splendidus]|uniref:uncharacterized protein LOC128768769 isoform X2 n=1 Tax=Synchiropus splendidus TaxID=270530 RepID=UPI00237D4791|nr:uncharacterized protein LOC128768769 isoform X2 [Synchiropus splendidus]